MLNVPPLPPHPAFRLRPFRGTPDYAGLAAVLTASEAADQVDRKVTAEMLAEAYPHLQGCDPATDLQVAEAGGAMIGYVRGWWLEEGAGRLYKHNAFIVPAWRRQGVGRALLEWVERRLRTLAATHPAEGPQWFEATASQAQIGAARLLEQAGYQPVRYFDEMVRPTLDDLPSFPLPDGVEVRPLRPEHYPALWQSIDEDSREEWGYQPATAEGYAEWLASPRFQPELWPVAWERATDRMVGHVLTFIDAEENRQFQRQRGYTEGVGVARAWRRRGLARALIGLSLHAQRAAGMRESALAADHDSASGVAALYERCGFRRVKRDTLYRKPLTRIADGVG